MKKIINVILFIVCGYCITAMDSPSIRRRKPEETLLVLIKEDNLELVTLMLENGSAHLSYDNYKALMLACQWGKKNIVAYFLTFNVPASTKARARMQATEYGHHEVAELFT